MQWTDEQRRAIEQRGANILLSAAAGSGKTTVLVERVLELIASGQGSIDRMLIVTFTRAASADMRFKLSRQLGSRAAQGDERCRRQQLLMERASISTLHGFCSEFLRSHFESAGVDPAFRILDDHEVRRITDEALDEAIEEAYAAGGEALSRLDYARGPKGVREMVGSLLHILQERADPDAWLERACACDDASRQAWIDELTLAARRDIDHALLLTRQALSHPDCNANYAPALEKDIQELLSMQQITAYSDFYRALHAFKQAAPGRKRDAGAASEEVKKLRQDAKAVLDKIALKEIELGSGLKDVAALAPQLKTLSAITLRARELLQQRKQERSGLSYADLEIYTLRALQDEAVAAELRSRYDHIFVDEYQDTSDLQEALVQRISRGDNLFMVGDVKQSIYRFRQAEPRLFLEKYHAYGRGEGGVLLPLTMNFRSRPAILDFVNHVFARAMHGGESEITYDSLARLNHGNAGLTGGDVHLHLLENPDDEGDDALQDFAVCERQALFIAGEIRRRMAENPELHYRDFAVLTRAKRGVLGRMAAVLLQQGIPAFADGSDDYYDSVEIVLALSLLKLTANRRSDIELIGVLRSPVVGLSEDELARIRIAYPDVPFCDAATAYAALNDDIARQLRAFFDLLEGWQLLALCTDLGVLTRRIFDESGLQDCMSALPGGSTRLANLNHLVQTAATFDQNVSGALTRFLKHIEKLQERGEGDDAHALGENDDVVRLMTAHKSKGLEFPVVFGAMLQRRYNSRSASAALAAHKDLGLGCLYCDPDLQTRRKTLPQLAIAERMKKEDRAEEKRILYVLLTRARDSLVLVGSVKNHASAAARWQAMRMTPGAAASYLDEIMPALQDGDESLCAVQLHSQISAPEAAPAAPVQDLFAAEPDADLIRALLWRYPDSRAARQPLKLTVTGLLRQLQSPDALDELIPRPAFLSEAPGRMTAAERGTAYHRIMQCLDLAALRGLNGRALNAGISAQIQSLLEGGRITPVQQQAVRPQCIARFLESETGARLLAAENVQREWPFNAMMRIREALEDDERGDYSDEEILVQGTIDCCFEEGGAWVLLDYKTDRSDDQDALTLRYRNQLRLYALALERITGMPVKEIRLCLLLAGETLAVPLQADSDAKVPW